MNNLKKKLKRQSFKNSYKPSKPKHLLRHLLIQYFHINKLDFREIKKVNLPLDYLENCHPELYKMHTKKDNRINMILTNNLKHVTLDDIIELIESIKIKPLLNICHLLFDQIIYKKYNQIDLRNKIDTLLHTQPRSAVC